MSYRRRNSYYFAGWGVDTTSDTLAASEFYAAPTTVSNRVIIDELALEVAVGAASSTLRFGIYRDDNGFPGSLVVDSGTVSSASSGRKAVAVDSGVLEAGEYWIGVVRQAGSAPTVTVWQRVVQAGLPQSSSAGASGVTYSLRKTSVTGALPDPFGTPGLHTAPSGAPRVQYHVKNEEVIQLLAADESDQALPIGLVESAPGVIPVNPAVETDVALPIGVAQNETITVGVATETDSAREILVGSPVRNLVTSGSKEDVASFTTTSYLPVGNRLVLAYIQSRPNNLALTPATPTMTGNGYVWVPVATVLDASGDHRGTLLRGLVASPTEGAATIDFGGQLQEFCSWSIAEIAGVDTSGTNGSGAIVGSAVTNTVATDSILLAVLPSFAKASNIGFAGFGMPTYRTVSSDPLYTIGSFGLSGTATVLTEWKVNQTTTGVIVSAPTTINGIAVEIKTA